MCIATEASCMPPTTTCSQTSQIHSGSAACVSGTSAAQRSSSPQPVQAMDVPMSADDVSDVIDAVVTKDGMFHISGGFRICERGVDRGERMEHQPIMGSPVGSRGTGAEVLVGVKVAKPPEAESLLSIFIEKRGHKLRI